MKKSILIIVSVVSTLATINAQEFNLGIKAGVNFATLQPDVTDPATRISFHLGGMVEIEVFESLSVQPELLYSAQGVKDEFDEDAIIRLDYLTLPVLAKYYIWRDLSIEAGPQFGILLSAKGEDNGQNFDGKDITKSTDLGFAVGLGYKMANGLNFNVRNYFGTDINSIEDSSDKVKNNVFQISIGYLFN